MFSIVTPSYNCEHTLHRVYDSLKAQTFLDFEWIIIDDCSQDNTKDLVLGWQSKEVDFDIKYRKLEKNVGMLYAINEGLKEVSRKYTIIADSDDSFEPNTLEDHHSWWNGIERTMNWEKIAGIWTLVKDEEGNLVGEEYPKNFWQVSFKERVRNRKEPIAGEKWHSWRSDILTGYKYVVHPNSHIGPSPTWTLINNEYDFICINKIHRTYWHNAQGISHQKKTRLKKEKRHYYSSLLQLRRPGLWEIPYFKHYRVLAYQYIKAQFFYRNPKDCLTIPRTIVCFIAFGLHAPIQFLGRVKNT